jgi:hypothetical protein
MQRKIVLILTLSFCLAACQEQNLAASPEIQQRLQQERSRLPSVTSIQKWEQVATISNPEHSMPGIVPLNEGDYRIFWNAPSLGGIGSATTTNGLIINVDEGARLVNGAIGQLDCVLSNPWVVQIAEGYRMYYQAQADLCNGRPRQSSDPPPVYRIMSAFSADGKNFQREPGVRIDTAPVTGLRSAGRGSVIQLDDGSYRMYFEGSFRGQGATYVLGATSVDGLAWLIDNQPIFEGGQAPTAIQLENVIYLYTRYLTDNVLLLQSTDAYTFTPASWIEFYNSEGNRIVEFHNGDILDFPEGQLYLFGSGNGSNGIGVFQRET